MPDTPSLDDAALADVLATFADDIDILTTGFDDLRKRITDVASRTWDAKLLTPPTDTGVRPKLYPIALMVARRITVRGERLTKTRLLDEMRDVECLSIKDQEREPLWEYVNGGLRQPETTEPA